MHVITRSPAPWAGRALLAALPLALGLAIWGPSSGPVEVGLKIEPAAAKPCPSSPRANPGTIGTARAASTVICLINRRRANQGLPRLEQRASLRLIASRHSQRMVRRGCFAYTCPGELPLGKRVRRRTNYLPCGCKFQLRQSIGGGARARGRPIRVVRRWIRTRRDRKVMFSRTLRHIGVGAVWGGPGAPNNTNFGTYTAIYGSRR